MRYSGTGVEKRKSGSGKGSAAGAKGSGGAVSISWHESMLMYKLKGVLLAM